jgi:hypothetical protein
MHILNILHIFVIFLDDNIYIDSYKVTTISNTNLYEARTSKNTVSELLDENDNITDENMCENDVLNVSIKIYEDLLSIEVLLKVLHKKRKQNVTQKPVITN